MNSWKGWEAGTFPTGCQDGADDGAVVKLGSWLDNIRERAAELSAERRA
ncbi:hypothetical protein [Streptomyces sp. NPDC018352]